MVERFELQRVNQSNDECLADCCRVRHARLGSKKSQVLHLCLDKTFCYFDFVSGEHNGNDDSLERRGNVRFRMENRLHR